jgi:type IV pilus assembly protein PilO
MASWSEIEPRYKIVILSLACVLIAAGIWYAVVRPMEQINRDDLAALKGKKAEIAQLMPFQARITQLNKEIETYRQQIEQQKQIVPEDKQVDGFIRMIQAQAHSSGIELRRFTAMPVVARDFYSELPFEIEIDGPYFGVVRFFEQIGKMERLVSVSGLAMANVKTPGQAKAKKTYKYAPGESVVATCTASAFFSPKVQPPPPPPAKAPLVKPKA